MPSPLSIVWKINHDKPKRNIANHDFKSVKNVRPSRYSCSAFSAVIFFEYLNASGARLIIEIKNCKNTEIIGKNHKDVLLPNRFGTPLRPKCVGIIVGKCRTKYAVATKCKTKTTIAAASSVHSRRVLDGVILGILGGVCKID